jgi:type II secretory pathway component GspD/PulD (secretin)
MIHRWLWRNLAFLAFSMVVLAVAPGPGGDSGIGYAAAEAEPNGGKETEAKEAGAEGGKAAAEPEIAVKTSGVTVHAVNVYAHLLFTRLAAKTGLQVVVDDAIKDRKVTVHLTGKSPQEVLSYIVSAYGLSTGEVNGVHMISEGIPRKPSSYLLSDIKSIPTQYVQASNAKSLLPVFLQDHVKVNYEQNAVVLSAPTDVLDKFEQDIQQFDVPAAQIMLEILVVEFTDWDTASYNLGIRWQSAGRGAEWGTLSLPALEGSEPTRGLGEVVLRGIADLPNEFRASLEALETARRAKVRAAPRIATVSGRWASFFVGIERYLRQPIETGDGGTTNFIDAGVRLNIAPWTGDGEEIICEIHPEVSTLSALDPVTGLPEKITRTADTMVRVKNGQTIVIGGLRQEEERRIRTKVPILGDIPLLGALFRSSATSVNRTDLVIFVTPRVLSLTGHLPPDEEQRLHERFLDEQER